MRGGFATEQPVVQDPLPTFVRTGIHQLIRHGHHIVGATRITDSIWSVRHRDGSRIDDLIVVADRDAA